MALDKLGIRTIITVVFGPFVLFCAWRGGYLFLALIASLIVLAMYEFYNLAAMKVTSPLKFAGIGTGIATCFLLYLDLMSYFWILLTAVFVGALIHELFRNRAAPILNVATTFMGIFYVALLLGFLIAIRELPQSAGVSYGVGGLWLILIFLSIWICDTAAYLLGTRFGSHKLFERVSPNKTVEGAVLGFIFAMATAYLYRLFLLQEVELVHVLVVGAICGSVGQISDLIESLFKRDAGAKDSSNILPGHGGILDRFDSEMLVAPVVFFYLRFVLY